MKAIVFELPGPGDLEEGRLDRILADLHRVLSYLPAGRVRQVVSYRGRPGLLLQLTRDDLHPACRLVRDLLDAERIEYIEHLYYGEPRTMPLPGPQACAASPPEFSPRRRKRELKRLLAGGHSFCRMDLMPDARAQFQAAHSLDPHCAEALYGLALVEAREGRDEVAERLLGRALDLDDGRAVYHLAMARLCYRSGRLEEAEKAARKSVALAPLDPQPYDVLGWTYLDMGQVERATAAFREALDLEPGMVTSQSGMGSALFAEGRFEESILLLEQALAEDPDYLTARLQLGWSRLHVGDLERAEADFLQVLFGEVEELRDPSAFGLGRLYLQKGSLLLAIENLRRCAGEWAQARWLLGEALFQAGQPAAAEVELLRALELDADLREEIEVRLAMCAMRQGHLDESETWLRRALEHQGSQVPLLELQAAIHGGRGAWDEARRVLEEACRIEPDAPTVHFQLGWVDENLSRPDQARDSYRRALRLDPECLEAALNLGWIFFDEGRTGEAGVLFERALEGHPEDGEALYGLGRVLYREGRFDGAIARLRQALLSQPERADTRAWLGAALCSAGRTEEGRRELRQALREGPDEDTASFIRRQLRQRTARTSTRSEGLPARARKKAVRLQSAS